MREVGASAGCAASRFVGLFAGSPRRKREVLNGSRNRCVRVRREGDRLGSDSVSPNPRRRGSSRDRLNGSGRVSACRPHPRGLTHDSFSRDDPLFDLSPSPRGEGPGTWPWFRTRSQRLPGPDAAGSARGWCCHARRRAPRPRAQVDTGDSHAHPAGSRRRESEDVMILVAIQCFSAPPMPLTSRRPALPGGHARATHLTPRRRFPGPDR